MNVRSVVSLLKSAERIEIVWEGGQIVLDPKNALLMDACGKYVVEEINSFVPGSYELAIATIPMRED